MKNKKRNKEYQLIKTAGAAVNIDQTLRRYMELNELSNALRGRQDIKDVLKSKLSKREISDIINLIKDSTHSIDDKYVLNNRYMRRVKFSNNGEEVCNSAEIGHIELKSGDMVPFDETVIYKGFVVNPSAKIEFSGADTIRIPAMQCDGISWMSLAPSEIKTLEKYIDRAHGKVINFGLGMGYFTYMAACKDNVTALTVVEQNKDIIKLFKQYILPQFEADIQKKITIVECDAFTYAKSINQGDYDYIFFDIWEGPSDGEDLCILAIDSISQIDCEKGYWLSDTIICNLYFEMIQLTYFILERILLGARILDIDKVLLRLTQNIDSNITNMLYLYIIDSFIKVYNNENQEEVLSYKRFNKFMHELSEGHTEKLCTDYINRLRQQVQNM